MKKKSILDELRDSGTILHDPCPPQPSPIKTIIKIMIWGVPLIVGAIVGVYGAGICGILLTIVLFLTLKMPPLIIVFYNMVHSVLLPTIYYRLIQPNKQYNINLILFYYIFLQISRGVFQIVNNFSKRIDSFLNFHSIQRFFIIFLWLLRQHS